MKLLIGTDAYPAFRLDALRDAIARACPELGCVEIDAKWVYALQAADGAFTADDLNRAASLLNATGECLGADFYVTARKGTYRALNSRARTADTCRSRAITWRTCRRSISTCRRTWCRRASPVCARAVRTVSSRTRQDFPLGFSVAM